MVAELLRERGVPPATADAVAPLAGGSISNALVMCDVDAGADRERFVAAAHAAIDARDTGPLLDFAEEAKKLPKDRLLAHLDALGASLANRGRSAAHTPGREAETTAARYAFALNAARQIEANASVQLTVESMFLRMRGL